MSTLNQAEAGAPVTEHYQITKAFLNNSESMLNTYLKMIDTVFQSN